MFRSADGILFVASWSPQRILLAAVCQISPTISDNFVLLNGVHSELLMMSSGSRRPILWHLGWSTVGIQMAFLSLLAGGFFFV